MKLIDLPSGAKLSITLAPFKDSKTLYQAVLEEMKTLKLDPEADVDVNLWKDLFCTFLSSKKIETALSACMQRALYNNLKISDDTFEPEAARDDYLTVAWEVAYANVLPFLKSLSAQYAPLLEKAKSTLKSKS